jgi:hypothetical protein
MDLEHGGNIFLRNIAELLPGLLEVLLWKTEASSKDYFCDTKCSLLMLFSTQFVSSQLVQSLPVLLVLIPCNKRGGRDLLITHMSINRDRRGDYHGHDNVQT